MQKHKYYLEHKAEILADVQKLGAKEAMKKWQIPWTTWFARNGLAVQWNHPSAKFKKPDKKPVTQKEKPLKSGERKAGGAIVKTDSQPEDEITQSDEIFAILDRLNEQVRNLKSSSFWFVVGWSDLLELNDYDFENLMRIFRTIHKNRISGGAKS